MKKVKYYSWWLLSQQITPPHNSVQHIYEEWDIIPIIAQQSGT